MKKTIFAVIAMSLLSACVKTTDNPWVSAIAGVEYKQEYPNKIPKIQDTECRNGWCFGSFQNEFEDYWVVFAKKDGSKKTSISVQCIGSLETRVYIGWNNVIHSDRDYSVGIDRAVITYRFDKQKPEETAFLVSGDYNETTSFYSKSFVEDLGNHKKLIVKAPTLNSVDVASFDLTGAKEALQPLLEYCGLGNAEEKQ